MTTKPLVDRVRQAWTLLTQLLQQTARSAQPWTILLELEAQAQEFLDENNVTWAFKWFNWFPANLCLSVNDCVVHGIPDETVLELWDVLKIDVWVDFKGWIADAAVTVIVWWVEQNPEAHWLVTSTKRALDQSLPYVKDWRSLFWYWKSVWSIINNDWYSVLEYLTWHWVGESVHQKPSIYNRPNPVMKRQFFKEWMIVALEPISALKSTAFVEWSNWWNIYTKHWDIWVQREYTVFVWSNWPEILAWVQDSAQLYT